LSVLEVGVGIDTCIDRHIEVQNNRTICPLNKAFGLSPDRFILQILRFANCSKKPYLAAVIKSQNLKIDFFMKNTKRSV